MNSQQKIINLLTICRKAGKLVIGFDAVKEAVYGGNASCVITASDISAKTYSGLDSDEFYDAVGKKVVVAAVCDYGFAVKFKSLGTVAGPHRGRKRKNGGNNSE